MTITCIIRYEIEPTQRHQFIQYAATWGQCIPSCGADLVGYFAPHEGSSTIAYGIYHVESLAHYEAYRAALSAHPLGQKNYEFAQKEKFLRREDRLFVKKVSGAHVPLVRT